METRSNREDYYWLLCEAQASRATCHRAHVGAVIINPKHHRPISSGYNGAPASVTSCLARGECYRQVHAIPSGTRQETCQGIHAEANAIGWIGFQACEGMEMYVLGHDDACIPCKRLIVNAGIARVYIRRSRSHWIMTWTREELIAQLNEFDVKHEIGGYK